MKKYIRYFQIALFLTVGCSGTQPPKPVEMTVPTPPPYPNVSLKTNVMEETVAQRFERIRDQITGEWLRDDPATARWLGFHEFDGKIADYSKNALTDRNERLQNQLKELSNIDSTRLSQDEALDRAILMNQIELFLFNALEIRMWETRPKAYEEFFLVNGYLDRDYAPIEQRAAKLLEHEHSALKQINHFYENIKGPLSRPIVETAIKIYKGYVEYLRNDVVKQLKGVGTPEFQKEFTETNEQLAKEAERIVKHLKEVELSRSDNSHVLGVERYKKFLKAQENIEIDLGEFKKMGEENLVVNKKRYEELARKVKEKRPKIKDVFQVATNLTNEARQFIVDKDLMTIPTADRAEMKESPPFMRWNQAFLDASGPFEKVKRAFYYISPPDPTWSKKEQEEYIPKYGVLMATTVHEVYPGHFLQEQWIDIAPTKVQKIFGAYSFIEGWAHYAEQLMIEEGFKKDDPQNELGQLEDALLRNCRYLVSIGVHTEGMTMEQAEKRFINDCKQDKASAREQAIRATFDPGYFAYTLGKIQILKLRDEAKAKWGNKFTLKRFHDALLAHGSPPIALIRDRVLESVP